ncbi:FAD binding domain-containing protein [Diaporthe helianthi]|uniref:FAD binding domain-containing protein n=1 Tax=Diaporthe helianthi TaxID=158607 RepID=A0A2P5I6M3_DIAHE|nr:FAD binding domain-containing protein [Diaporthe helianthi]
MLVASSSPDSFNALADFISPEWQQRDLVGVQYLSRRPLGNEYAACAAALQHVQRNGARGRRGNLRSNSRELYEPQLPSRSSGRVPAYYIAVQGASEVTKAFEFARRYNVALSIKNSGHDYVMRSSQRGSLAL